MFTVISFDVSDDRRRSKLVKVLRGYAQRVQKSVFEATDLSPAVFLRMRSKLESKLDLDEDRIRYHRLCAACAARVEHAGVGLAPELGDVDAIIVP
jgi:CRISPR-associated protein Cas2